MSVAGAPSLRRGGGFSLVDVLIVVSIITVMASIAVPSYNSRIEAARAKKATQDLRMIALSIDVHCAKHAGVLPRHLAEVGQGGRLDPWGREYLYLSFQTATGNGYRWAVALGITTDAIFTNPLPATDSFDLARSAVVRTVSVFSLLTGKPGDERIEAAVAKLRRIDRQAHPVNSDYDLFSLGGDGSSSVSLGADAALDDVLRGRDGEYLGPAATY